MKFYENLSPSERKKLVLRAVAVDSYMEGMISAQEECLEMLREVEREDKSANLAEPTDRKAG